MSRKRKYKCGEGEDVSSVQYPTSNASIHGVLTSVSPMMCKKHEIFHGGIRDEKIHVESDAQRELLENKEEKGVLLTNCEVKHAAKNTEIQKLPSQCNEHEKVMFLKELQQLDPFQTVMVEVRVDNIEECIMVHGRRKKQDIHVRDATGTARLSLWGAYTDKLMVDRSYRLSGLLVNKFKEKNFLSTANKNATIFIEEIPCTKEIFTSGPSQSNRSIYKENVRIIGVNQFDYYYGCLKCNAKVMPGDEGIGECAKCYMVQSLPECQKMLTSTVIVKDGMQGKLMLQVYHETILDIAERPEREISPTVLLNARPFSMSFCRDAIQSISREF